MKCHKKLKDGQKNVEIKRRKIRNIAIKIIRK